MTAATDHTFVDVNNRNPWRAGVLARMPWVGFAALLGTLICASAGAIILILSNGNPLIDWSVQPTVWLAITTALANILLHFALSEGATISFWRKAVQGGTINDLHREWAYANGLWASLTAGRHFNLMALACLIAACSPINGPLLQRASTVTTEDLQNLKPIKIRIAPEIPADYTGVVTGRTYGLASLLTTNFTQIMNAYSKREDIHLHDTGCAGTCTGRVHGAGWIPSCVYTQQSYDIYPRNFDNGSVDTSSFNGSDVFTTNFTLSEQTSYTDPINSINITTLLKDTPACSGEFTVVSCYLQSALVSYPVVLKNDTISLDPNTSIADDQLISKYKYDPQASNGANAFGPQTLGGMVLALNNLFGSKAHLSFGGAVSWILSTTGSLPNQYVASVNNTTPSIDCNMTWTNPTDDILVAMREIMFRTAVQAAAGNASATQSIQAMESSTRTIYRSNFLFLGLGLLVTFLGVVAVLPVFRGFSMLGRNVSMSPIETAKAFSAPGLNSSDPNADSKTLLSEIGGRPVQYGEVLVNDGRLIRPGDPVYEGMAVRRRLEMASPSWVGSPRQGTRFTN